ncbi:MAG: hypothetical protein WCF23_18460 [Candidatus Nitrosopolaris sp.]
MESTNLGVYSDYHNAIPILQELGDKVTFRIIISTIDSAKTVSQIHEENKIPLSSIYKKVQKLCKVRLLSVEKIDIDSKGKKVVFYRSKVRSMEFNLNAKGILLHLDKNNIARRSTTGNYPLKGDPINIVI